MKILLIIVVLYGGWKLFGSGGGGGSSSSGGSARYSTSSGSSGGSSAKRSAGSKVTKAQVEAAKRRMTEASQELAALQNSSAGAGTQDRQVEYHGNYRHTQTMTFDNSGVNERSAAIKQATLNVQAAQREYAEVYRAYQASGGK